MPKLKTHKGTKKVLKVRKSGSIKIGRPGSRPTSPPAGWVTTVVT